MSVRLDHEAQRERSDVERADLRTVSGIVVEGVSDQPLRNQSLAKSISRFRRRVATTV